MNLESIKIWQVLNKKYKTNFFKTTTTTKKGISGTESLPHTDSKDNFLC